MRMKRIAFLVIALLSFTLACNAQEYVDDVGSVGARNAVKKAHQMTDLEFVPRKTIVANTQKTYRPDEKSKGLIYSLAQDKNTYVGLDVSFHTFMTAVNNPGSVLYTSGAQKAYYGTVCSTFVSYALGFPVYQTTNDFPKAKFLTLIGDQSAKGIQLADVLFQEGHVALITGIRRNKATGEIVRIEISEAWRSGCRRRVKNGEADFNAMLKQGKWKIYRYKDLDKNGYEPLTDFVAVDGEQRTPFQYNDDICPSKGDKSCYIVGENVVLNIDDSYNKIEIYRDSELYRTVKVGDSPSIVLEDLPYGDYEARLKSWWKRSRFAYWKVIDVDVKADTLNQRVYFNSENARPVYLEFCSAKGARPSWAVHVIDDEDISNGYVKVTSLHRKGLRLRKSDMFVKVHFECDYGRVINRPVLWKKGEKNSEPETDTDDDTIEDATE